MKTDVQKPFYRPELDGLRALAIAGVLLFHLGVDSFGGGYLGVDVFFVLSGYLISRLVLVRVEEKSFSYIDFYVRRARRLLPALFVATGVNLLLAALLFNPEHFEEAAEAGFYSILSLANIHSWLSSGYFDLSGLVKPFLHYWSLSVEEQFYLIWPALIVFGFGALNRRAGIGLLVILSAVSFISLVAIQETDYNAAFYLMPFRIWEFGIGAVIAASGLGLMEKESRKLSHSALLSSFLTILGSGLIAASFLIGQKIFGLGNQLMLAVFGAALVIMTPSNPASKLLLGNPAFIWLGKRSYSLYLWHWPVIVYLRYYVGVELSPAWMALATVLSLGLAAISYRYVENRFRRPWFTDKSKDRLAVTAALAPAALAIVFVSTMVWTQGGWRWRISSDLDKITTAATVHPKPNCDWRNVPGASRRLCYFGDRRDAPDVAVIGDSHAASLAAGMTLPLQTAKLTGVAQTSGGKPPLMNSRLWVNDVGDRGGFDQEFQDVFLTKPEYLILHARYAVYWHTEGLENELRTITRYLGPPTGEMEKTAESSQRQFKTSLRETLIAIKKAGITPVVVGPIPNPGIDTVVCLSKPPVRTLEKALAACDGFSQAESAARNAEVMAALQQISHEEGVLFYDPTHIFCRPNERKCTVIKNSRLIYRDSNHLSLFGARLLGGKVLAFLQADILEE